MSFSRVWVGSVEKVVAGVVGWFVTRKREPLMMELSGGAVVDQRLGTKRSRWWGGMMLGYWKMKGS
jgi:hypothetical protein